MSFFDNAVNEGPYRATVLLQRALGVSPDGVWGPKTQAAVDGIGDAAKLIEDLATAREAFYRSLGTFRYFGKGWTNRANDIEVASLQMAKGIADESANAGTS